MHRIFAVLILLSIVLSSVVNADYYEDLAFYHAPIHYQDTDSTNYPAEYITAIDYDSDWIADNNWDNLSNGLWPATVYYSVVESCSHYFITYAFFHPRDWTDTPFDGEHENDLEGALFVIRKNGTSYGAMEGMITVFHTDFYSFIPSGSPLTNGHENIDGSVTFNYYEGSNRALTAQEAKGHGLKAWPYIGNFTGNNNQDGIVYYPTRGSAEYPSSGNDRLVRYRLVNIFQTNGLWTQAMNEASLSGAAADTFNAWGTFKGNNSGGCGGGAFLASCSNNSANAPWGWNDGNDGASYRGEFAMHPVKLVDHYFDGLGVFSSLYINNRYAEDLRTAGYSSAHKPNGYTDALDLDQLFTHLTNSCPQ